MGSNAVSHAYKSFGNLNLLLTFAILLNQVSCPLNFDQDPRGAPTRECFLNHPTVSATTEHCVLAANEIMQTFRWLLDTKIISTVKIYIIVKIVKIVKMYVKSFTTTVSESHREHSKLVRALTVTD